MSTRDLKNLAAMADAETKAELDGILAKLDVALTKAEGATISLKEFNERNAARRAAARAAETLKASI
jgi:hypothetical protein